MGSKNRYENRMNRKKGYAVEMQNRVFMLVLAFGTAFSVSVSQQGNKQDSLRHRLGRVPLKDEYINQGFQRQNITETKVEQLKKIGFDLREELSRGEGRDERVDAAMLDMVLIGKVMNIIDLPGPRADPFHSKVVVQIMELLRGPKQAGDTIQLLRQGGPITDYRGGKAIIRVSTESTMRIGETAAFFLTNVYHDSYLTTVNKSFFSRQHLDLPNPSYWVSSNNKHGIVGSVVRYYDRDIPLDVFTSEMKEIAKIVDEPSPK
jgi:hypothetical protein